MDYPDHSEQIVAQSKVKLERYPQLKLQWRHVCETGSDINNDFFTK